MFKLRVNHNTRCYLGLQCREFIIATDTTAAKDCYIHYIYCELGGLDTLKYILKGFITL